MRFFLTDRVRFELTIPLRVRQFSRLVPSTTRPPIQSAFTIGSMPQPLADISRVRPLRQWEFTVRWTNSEHVLGNRLGVLDAMILRAAGATLISNGRAVAGQWH